MFSNSIYFFFVLIIFSLLKIQPAVAADKPEDSLRVYQVPSITVTTTRAVSGQTPVPFSEINKADIQKSYTVQDLPQLLSDLPSVIFRSESGNGIGYSYLTMRGFDQRRISVLVNGIPQNDPEDHNVYWIDFPDISSNLDNIQVQRGAGLASYGAASIGGSINLTTSNYVDHQGITIFYGLGMQEYGAGGSNKFQPTMAKNSIEFSSGLVKGNYAFYGRLSRISSDGYRDRSWARLNSFFLSAVRFDEHLTTQINVFGGPLSDGLAYTGLPKSYVKDPELRRKNPSYWGYDSTGHELSYFVERRSQEVEGFSQPHYELLNDLYINENLTLKSALFYYSGEGYFDYDGSWVDAAGFGLTKDNGFDSIADPTNSIIRAFVSNRQGGWIPRLIWNHGSGELMAGAEIRLHRSEHWGKIEYAENLPVGYDPDYKFYTNNGERDIFSVFARERYQAAEKLALSAEIQLVRQAYRINNEKMGGRFTSYQTVSGGTAGNGGDLFNVSYIFFNPRFGANFILNDNNDFYGLAAYTSREPRMRNLYAADDNFFGSKPLFEGKRLTDTTVAYDFSKPLIKPERMLDLELGWNAKYTDFHISADVFIMEYFDEFVKSGRVNIFGDPIDGNAKRTRHLGLELQAACMLMHQGDMKVEVLANTTISRNRIVESDFVTSNKDVVSLAGNPISGFPDFMANLRMSVSTNNFFASVSGKYVGQYRSDSFGDMIKTNPLIISHLGWDYYDDNTVDPYVLMNADVSYTFEDILSLRTLKLQAQVFNVLNTYFAGGAEGKDFFPGAERNVFIGLELGL